MIKKIKTWFILQKLKRNPLFWTKKPIPYIKSKDVKKAKKRAMRAHEKTGKQYHIMPMGNQVIIIDNEWRKHYNRLKRGPKVNINNLLHMAHFSTPSQRTLKTKAA